MPDRMSVAELHALLEASFGSAKRERPGSPRLPSISSRKNAEADLSGLSPALRKLEIARRRLMETLPHLARTTCRRSAIIRAIEGALPTEQAKAS
jgi:hypothetical protein